MEPRVRDAMSELRSSLAEEQPLADAMDEMQRLRIRAMPVVDAGGRFRGQLVWRDVEEALRRGDGESLTVADVCRNGVAVGLDDSLDAAHARLDAEQVGRLAVVDESMPVGVITRSHIREFSDAQRRRAAFDEICPPDELVRRYEVSADAFFESGRHGVTTLRNYGLEPHHHILDPGCGAGRMAIALTQYLSPEGRYEGFDLFRDCIEWCSGTITPRYPNFGFTHADIFYKLHNEAGKMLAKDYRFPYGDEDFDFVVLISVFTHIREEGFEQYLSEIARVLRPGGRIYASFMLLNDDTLQQIDAGRSPLQPRHDFGHYRVANKEYPEDAVAYREDYVRRLYTRLGFEITDVIAGDWASTEHPGMGSQDGVVATKVHGADGKPAVQSARPGA